MSRESTPETPGIVDFRTIDVPVSFTVVSAFAVQISEALPIRPLSCSRRGSS